MTIRLYHQALVDVADGVLEAAALQCLQECTFWPTVAEVRKRCVKTGWTMEQAEAQLEAYWERCYRDGAFEPRPGIVFRGEYDECRRAHVYYRELSKRKQRMGEAEFCQQHGAMLRQRGGVWLRLLGEQDVPLLTAGQ